ncbi:hypothetical protein Tco_0088825 [Tanacetum coccineum]
MNDDTPMCKRHEVNYTQSGGYQNRNSHDSYSHQPHYEQPHSKNDPKKSLTKLINDVKNNLEDFKSCIRSKRTDYENLFDKNFCKPARVLPKKKSKTINQEPQSKTDLEKLITKFLDGQRVANMYVNQELVLDNHYETAVRSRSRDIGRGRSVLDLCNGDHEDRQNTRPSSVEEMAPKRAPRSTPVIENPTTTTVTNGQLQAMIDQGVTDALTARDANRNGDDNHTSGNDFLKCKPLNFKGTEGIIELTQWFEKMESVFSISNCIVECQVKFATCTLQENALTWWNSHVKTTTLEVAHAMPWKTLKKMMTDKITGVFARIEVMKPWNNKLKVTKARGIGKDQAMLESTLLKTSCQGKQNFNYIKFCVRPFKVLEQVESVAYKLKLPQELSWVHNTFHVSNLKKCYSDDPLVVPLEGLQVDNKLHFVEEPVEIIDREVKQLRRSRVLIVKGLCTENLIHHIKHFLSIVDHIQVDGATKDASRLCFFYFSLKGIKYYDYTKGNRKDPFKDSWIRFQVPIPQQAPIWKLEMVIGSNVYWITNLTYERLNETSTFHTTSIYLTLSADKGVERMKIMLNTKTHVGENHLNRGKHIFHSEFAKDHFRMSVQKSDSEYLFIPHNSDQREKHFYGIWRIYTRLGLNLRRNRTRLQLYTKRLKNYIQTLETTSGFKAMPSGFGSDGVSILATASEHSRQSGLTASQLDETASRDKEDHSTCTASLQKFGVATLKSENRNGEFGPKAVSMFADEDADTMLRAYDDGVLEFVQIVTLIRADDLHQSTTIIKVLKDGIGSSNWVLNV